MTQRSFDPDFLDREWVVQEGIRGCSDEKEETFQILTWNVQADKMRYPPGGHQRGGRGGGKVPPGADREPLEHMIYSLLNSDDSSGISSPDILILQELQQCDRQFKRKDCRYHIPNPENCSFNHADWVEKMLEDNGYVGGYHTGRVNTVGLYYRTTIWKNITDSRCENKMLFVTFSKSKKGKGAVLAVLQHKVTGQRLLAVAVHLSVPMCGDVPSTDVPIEELEQLSCKIDNVMSRHGSMPVVIAGDFNSLNTDAYQSLPSSVSGTVAPPDVYDKVVNEWGFTSSYSSVLGSLGAAYSSVDPNFRHCIDYIFIKGNVETMAVLDVKKSFEDRDQPYPSDHLPLSAYLRFVTDV